MTKKQILTVQMYLHKPRNFIQDDRTQVSRLYKATSPEFMPIEKLSGSKLQYLDRDLEIINSSSKIK